ncbi:MAG: D-sedoheptulose 7-phosphate isomerase [Alphaproteobacteria bacterium]
MDWRAFHDQQWAEHEAVAAATRAALAEPFGRLVEASLTSLKAGGKLMFFGNGGSAADAQHLATELTVRYDRERAAIPALALTTDTSALTAIGNDFGFERLFARQIEALGAKGDVAIGISTSGRSANVTAALREAGQRGMVAAALSGRDGGDLVDLADPLLIVPSDVTARIQEMHIALGQMLCDAVQRGLGLVKD